jgi:hypothetical protein
MLFTFQIVTEFVPPVMESKNCWVVTTFTETVAGEMVTLIFVTGSVHVDVEVVAEVVEVVVVHVTPVLVAAFLHEAKPERAMSKTKNRRRFTAPLSSLFEIPNAYGSASTLIPKMRNYNLILAGRAPRPGANWKSRARKRSCLRRRAQAILAFY